MDLKGKVAIVTGASGGIGEATARLLTQKGAKVALAARSSDKLKKLSEELPQSYPVYVDMSKEESIKDMVQEVLEHFERVDILVNNAGQGYDAPIDHIDPKMYRDIFDLNVIGPLIAMQEVLPSMRKQQSGSIVNISSGTALMFLPGMAPYSSSKRALVGLSLTGREELKDENISVSVVYPFITATDFEKHTIKSPSIAQEEAERHDLPPADSAEFVAEKILEAITTGKAEVFAHEWMEK